MEKHEHDLVIIGAGPGGYVAAIRAAQLGMNAGCVEMEPRLGGTCLRVGCIPSKALLESSLLYYEARNSFSEHGIQVGEVGLDLAAMMRRKDEVVSQLTSGVEGLFKKNGVTRYLGRGRMDGPGRVIVEGGEEAVELLAPRVVIATGSRSADLRGVELDGDLIGTSTEALCYPEVPGHLVVIGAGVIGLELGSVWLRLGSRVTVLEYLDRILPGVDAEIAREAHRVFKKQGFEFHLGARVTSARVEGRGARPACVVEREGGEGVQADRVLLVVGRAPYAEGLNLQSVGLSTDERGRIPVDEHCATAAAGIYAVGDVIAGPMLAHKAEDEGVACAEHMATGYGHVDYGVMPAVVYTEPEIGAVGKTEDELQAAGMKLGADYRKGVFMFRANGRARAMGHIEGRVKILADAGTDRVLGVHIIGPYAGELIAEAAMAMQSGASSEDVARTCHAHPTLSEAVKEAALSVDGRAIHA